MLYLAASYSYAVDNEFELREIYVSDDETLFVLKSNEGFVPQRINGSVIDVVAATKNAVYPLLGFSEIRTYNDDDPKSLATFLHTKITKVDIGHLSADKALFNVIASFGDSYED